VATNGILSTELALVRFMELYGGLVYQEGSLEVFEKESVISIRGEIRLSPMDIASQALFSFSYGSNALALDRIEVIIE
jgi:hypothetical protein